MGVLRRLLALLIVLWAGSLWSLALWVAPTLFYAQTDRHLAGLLAAQLFRIESYLGLAVAGLALALRRRPFAKGYAAAALLLVNEWALKPLMTVARAQGTALGLGFLAWHGLSALLYLAACAAVLWLLVKSPATWA